MVPMGARWEEKRESVDGRAEEMFGPPVAVPFGWEEAPGKAKPSEAEKVLQIQNNDDFYRLLLSKEGKLGLSSGSLYRPTDAGTVPFVWEAEPGKPKTPAREPDDRLPATLNPPPSFHSSPRPDGGAAGSRSSSISLKKWIFPGRSTKSGEQNCRNNYTPEAYSWVSGSSDSGASKSSSHSSDFSSKTWSSSASSSRAASPRRKFYTQGAACFSGANPARSPAPSFRRSISTGSSHNNPAGPSRNRKNGFSSELLGGGGVPQSLRKHHDRKENERGDFKQDQEPLQERGGLEFQNGVSDSPQGSEESEFRLSNAADSGDCVSEDHEAIMELEILMRFPQVRRGNKKVAPMYGCRVSKSPWGFLACLPFFAIHSRRARVYEDCLDLHRKH